VVHEAERRAGRVRRAPVVGVVGAGEVHRAHPLPRGRIATIQGRALKP
jgi:hypothetical protein